MLLFVVHHGSPILSQNVTLPDVLDVVGYPPFHGYAHDELKSWIESSFPLEYRYVPYASVSDLKKWISVGMPVIIHQTPGLERKDGHNRVITGYDDARGVFYLNDPINWSGKPH